MRFKDKDIMCNISVTEETVGALLLLNQDAISVSN